MNVCETSDETLQAVAREAEAHRAGNILIITKCTAAKEKLYHQICKSGSIMDLPINHMHYRLLFVR